jgi:hypothetical protein
MSYIHYFALKGHQTFRLRAVVQIFTIAAPPDAGVQSTEENGNDVLGVSNLFFFFWSG